MQLNFGSGAIWGERPDMTGSGIGPRQFGVLQDIQIDFDIDKPLHKPLRFPMVITHRQGKITGKAKSAQILGLLYSDIFFGDLRPAHAGGRIAPEERLYPSGSVRPARVPGSKPTTPIFKATFYTSYAWGGTALRLNACVADKLSFPTKIADWTLYDLDFSAFADASGTIGYLSTLGATPLGTQTPCP